MKNHYRLYWTCQLVGWGIYCLISLGLTFIFQGAGKLTASLLLFHLIFVFLMISSTHGLRWYMKQKRWLALSLQRLLIRLLPTIVGISILTQALMWLAMVYIVQLYTLEQTSFLAYWAYVFYCALILMLWSTLYLTISLFRQRQQQEVDKWKLVAALRDTELQALKAQINPHFVFNSLNNIRSMIAEDQEQARQMVTYLSELLRYSLQYAHRERVPLRQEIEVVLNYLKLEAVQLEERLQYTLTISEEALEVEIPPMSLQLLVENAIKHGIAQLPKGGMLQVIAEVHQEQLQVNVINSGQLENGQQQHSLGIGFRNVTERLQLLFGSSTLTLLNSSADTVTASFYVPIPRTA